MGGPPPPPHRRTDRRGARQDPVEIPRGDLRDHVADLDQVYAAIEASPQHEAAALLGDVLCSLHNRLFPHLPDGRPGGGVPAAHLRAPGASPPHPATT